MKNRFILFLLIFIQTLFILLSIPSVNAADSMTKTVIKSGTLQEGVTYEKFSSVLSHEGAVKNEIISYVRKDSGANNVKAVVWGIRDNGFQLAAIDKIAEDYEKKHPDEEVLAILNGDYFSHSDGTVINREVIEGTVNKSTNYAASDRAYVSLAINDDSNALTRVEELSYYDNYTLKIYDAAGAKLLKEVVVSLNEAPNNTYKTAMYFNNTTNLVANDNLKIYDVFNSLMNLTNPNSYILGGLIMDPLSETGTNRNTLRIATIDNDVIELLQKNNRIKITKEFKVGSNNVIGAGSQPLKNNQVLTYTEIMDNPEHERVGTTPRSSIGVTKDGDLILCAIDGRQSSAGMVGVTVREEAYIMQQLGCVDCYNLDGGGSTQLYIKEDGKFVKLNNPSEAKRYISNCVLFVQKKAGVNYTTEISGENVNLTLTPVNANGVEVLETSVYWNGKLINGLNNVYKFKALNSEITSISVEVKFKQNGTTYTSAALNKRFIPTGFNYTCTEKIVNKTNLYQLISNGYALDISLYEASSVEAFNKAFASAILVSDDNNCSQSDVDAAITSLQEAFNNLKNTKDLLKDDLKAKIDEAKAIDKTLYETMSVVKLNQAINNANTVYNNIEATEAELQSSLDTLTEVINNLVPVKSNDSSSCTSFAIIEIFTCIIPLLGLVLLLRKNNFK